MPFTHLPGAAMNDRELKLSVVLSAQDKFIAPIRRAIDGTNKLAKATKEAKDEIKKLGDQQALIGKYENTNRSIGINTNELKKAQQEVANIKARWANSADVVPMSVVKRLEKANEKVVNLKGTITNLNTSKDTLRANLEAIGVNVAETGALSRANEDLTAKIKAQNSALAVHQTRLQAVADHQKRIRDLQYAQKSNRERMQGAGIGMVGIAASAAAAAVPVAQAAQFETAMLGVAKQVEGARDESGQLTQVYYDMYRQVQMLGRELPMATNEIAAMVAAGARMGIARDELIAFTRTSAQMADAFELPAAELADQMGKIAGLFKIPIPRVAELADVINYLDDNAISKGAEIIDVLKRIGGTAQFLKMPANEAAALASTFLTLGSSAEVAATAANAVMRELSVATMQPKRFGAGLDAIGMDARKLQRDMSRDATGTIQRVLSALNKLPDERRLTVATQLFGKEYGDDVAKLAGGIEEYRRQLALARSEQAKGSMGREAAARGATTAAQWERTKNIFSEMGVNIGSALLPIANDLLEKFRDITSTLADFAKENPNLIRSVGYIGMAFGSLLFTIKALEFGVFGGFWAINTLRIGYLKAVPIVTLLASWLWKLGGVIGLVTSAIIRTGMVLLANPMLAFLALIAAAAFLIIANWSTVKAWWSEFWGSAGNWVKKAFDTMDNYFSDLGNRFTQWGSDLLQGFSNGIASKWQAIKDQIGIIADSIAQFFKDRLGINSPSRLFAEFGGYTMEGFGVGLTEGQRGTVDAMKRVMAGVAAAGVVAMNPANAAPTTGKLTAGGGNGGTIVQQTNHYTLQIIPTPGMNESALGDLVIRKVDELERQRGVASRSSLRDRD
ncbi:MAG: phage tail tape measure protein [Fluviibacter sp.]